MTTGTTAAIQIRHSPIVSTLLADFQGRSEPQFSWKSVVSQFLAIPGLRAFWPMSSVNDAGARCIDLTHQGNDLTDNNTAMFRQWPLQVGVALPYTFHGLGRYLYRADGAWADISGTETFVTPDSRGLTWGGWFDPQSFGDFEEVFNKWGAAGQRSFTLQITATNDWQALISDDGTNSTTVTSTVPVDFVNNWQFVVARFDPGASIDIFMNGTWDTQATARASIFNSNAELAIGAQSGGANQYEGGASMCFLSCMYVSDAIINQLFEQTRAAYGLVS